MNRIRWAVATLTSAPWRRAPFLLWRRPGLLAAVAGATAAVAASLASVPLFTSSVGSASVQLQIDERCPRDLGATRRFSAAAAAIRSPSPDPFTPVADRLGPSNWWARVEDVPLRTDAAGADPLEVNLLVRGGALDHVDVLESREGSGVWLSDRAAERTGLGAGDFASLGTTRVAVAGVYRDLSGPSVDSFWCSNADLLLLEGQDLIPPPPLVLVDRATLAAVMRDLGRPSAQGAWQAGLLPGLTLDEADELLGVLTCRDGARTVAWCASGARPQVPGSATGPFRDRPVEARDETEFANRFLQSSLPFAVDRTRAIQTSVGGGIWAIAALATLAGLGLVAAAAALWLERRRREVALLAVRGVSPAAVGVKAVLELVVPLVVGAAAGVGAAYAVVAGMGPSPAIEPSAVRGAVAAGALAMAAAVAVVASVVARRADAGRDHARAWSRWLALAPWEVLLGWATVVSYRRLGEWGVPTGRGAEVSRVDLWGLLFPVLFLITSVAAVSRLLALAIGPIRRVSRAWPTALYLGVRRVARYRVAALGLVAGSSLAAGVLGYAATMNRSLDTTLLAKGRTYVGSDVALRLSTDEQLPITLREHSTEVGNFRHAWVQLDRRVDLTVMAVDPTTFARAAFWDDTFGRDLEEVLDELRSGADDRVVPAVVMGADLGTTFDLAVVGSRTRHLPVTVVGGVDTFPGMRPHEPTVYVAASALDRIGADGQVTETWVRGDPEDIRAVLDESGTGFQEVRALSGIADRAAFRTVSWTFGYLQTIGLSAGLLVIGGLAVYLDARSRHRLLGYALMRRMGLPRHRHRRALGVELAASVLVGALAGLAIAGAGAALAYVHIDPVPRYAPDPLLRLASTTAFVLAVGTAVLTVVAVLLGQRRMDRDDPVEVLRAGA